MYEYCVKNKVWCKKCVYKYSSATVWSVAVLTCWTIKHNKHVMMIIQGMQLIYEVYAQSYLEYPELWELFTSFDIFS